jgi:hypothetical protein
MGSTGRSAAEKIESECAVFLLDTHLWDALKADATKWSDNPTSSLVGGENNEFMQDVVCPFCIADDRACR